MPLKQLEQGIQENAGKFKCFRNPLCQEHIYLQACVLSVRAGAGEGSVLGSNNPKPRSKFKPRTSELAVIPAVRNTERGKG